MNLYKKARIQYIRTFYKCKICNMCGDFGYYRYCEECVKKGKPLWYANKEEMIKTLNILCPYYINAIKYWAKYYMLFYKIRIKMLWKRN